MIDFDELEALDETTKLHSVLDDASSFAFRTAVDEINKAEEKCDFFCPHDPFKCAREPRQILGTEDVWREVDGRLVRGQLAWETSGKAAVSVTFKGVAAETAGTVLALLVPFREDAAKSRSSQLALFLRHFHQRFLRSLPADMQERAVVLVLEQTRCGAFNRGKLMNIGALWCRAHLKGDVLLCFHDVDMLPEPSLAPYYCHCQVGECVHIGWVNRKYDYPHFFGGVCAVPIPDFFAAGGFPSSFWGWGREDDVFHARLRLLSKTKVFVPAAEEGMVLLPGPRKESADQGGQSENRMLVQHLLGLDNVFDPMEFSVVEHEEHGWLCHLLLELRHPGVSHERASSFCSLAALLEAASCCTDHGQHWGIVHSSDSSPQSSLVYEAPTAPTWSVA